MPSSRPTVTTERVSRSRVGGLGHHLGGSSGSVRQGRQHAFDSRGAQSLTARWSTLRSKDVRAAPALTVVRGATTREDHRMSLTLLGWRRTVHALYAEVRSSVDAGTAPEEAHARWREGRDHLFRDHPDTPLLPEDRADFQGLTYAPYDPELRFTALLDTDVEPTELAVQTGTDGVVRFERFGVLRLPDGMGTLDAWWLKAYGGGLFVPVKDTLAGPTTYGGGRYLLDTVKGADLGGSDDGLVLDLNFAYQPSCAYDPAWACPLAPPGNTLAVPLFAGELYAPSEH